MDIFARVKDGKIVEYPVYAEHIKARGLPVTWFVKCQVEEQPAVDEFSYAVQVPQLVNETEVVVSWKICTYQLEQLLMRLPVSLEAGRGERRNPRTRLNESPTETMIAKIKQLAEDRIEDLLDAFAQTRGYKDLERAVSYIGDKNPKWDAEGTYCRDVRSDTWVQLQAYFADVTATPQVKPWPNTWRDIVANIPTPTWPAEAVTPAP